MIEIILRDYLADELDVDVCLEKPKPAPEKYVLLDRTGGSDTDRIPTATFAIESFGPSLYEAADLNEQVKAAMTEMPDNVPEVFRAQLNSDGNHSNTQTKERRYLAVYHITYKEATT